MSLALWKIGSSRLSWSSRAGNMVTCFESRILPTAWDGAGMVQHGSKRQKPQKRHKKTSAAIHALLCRCRRTWHKLRCLADGSCQPSTGSSFRSWFYIQSVGHTLDGFLLQCCQGSNFFISTRLCGSSQPACDIRCPCAYCFIGAQNRTAICQGDLHNNRK